MRIWSDCMPCIVTMAANLARDAGLAEDEVKDFLLEVLNAGLMPREATDAYSALIVTAIWEMLVQRTGDPDALRTLKRSQNEAALALYPAAAEVVARSADPLGAALKFCIAGNVLDTMVGQLTEPTTGLLQAAAAMPLNEAEVGTFRDRLASARRLVLITDNCGEIVFDRLLLETIRDLRGQEVQMTVVARTVPALNDATAVEAMAVGLDTVARVIGNGSGRPVPSTRLEWVSPEVRQIMAEADILISKGGANFELLEEEQELARRITFLLHGKCRPLCSRHGAEAGEFLISNR